MLTMELLKSKTFVKDHNGHEYCIHNGKIYYKPLLQKGTKFSIPPSLSNTASLFLWIVDRNSKNKVLTRLPVK